MRRASVAVGAVLLALLPGCGGDSSNDTAASSPPLGAPATGQFSGKDSAQFCELVRTYTDRLKGLTRANTTQTQLRHLSSELETAIQEAVTVAPAEIKAEVTLVARTATEYLAALEKAGYDFAKMPQDATARSQTPEMVTASGRLEAYSRSVCKTT